MTKTINLPKLPYHQLPDHRPNRINKDRSVIVEVVELADHERRKSLDLTGRVDVADYLQWHFPTHAQWMVGDQFFLDIDGNALKGIEAYCDFDGGTFLRLTERIFAALISENGTLKWLDARETFAHEFGHLTIRGHKRKLAARARVAATRTGKRAARSADLYEGDGKFDIKARNLDLEEEADAFAYAFLVPVTELDGTLTVEQLATIYSVSNRVAYQAALLAKEYVRNKFILEHRST